MMIAIVGVALIAWFVSMIVVFSVGYEMGIQLSYAQEDQYEEMGSL